MTKKEAIAKVKKSGDWTESEATMIVEDEIKKNPDYLEEVRLVDVEEDDEGYEEPIQGMDILDWTPTKVHSGSDSKEDLGRLGKSLEKAARIAFPGGEDKPEGMEMYKGFGSTVRDEDIEELWNDDLTDEQKRETLKKELNIGEDDEDRDRFADPEETDEERLERQIDYFNSLRDHVSDSDMGYMQQQDPESLYSQGRDVDNTMIVEALQRRAMGQGNVGDVAELPIGRPEDQGLNYTPANQDPGNLSIIQALENQNRMRRPGMPGSDVNSLYESARRNQGLATMQSGRRGRFPGIGGSRGSWGPEDWNPYGGRTYGG